MKRVPLSATTLCGALHEKQTNRKEWNHEKCMTVWTKTGHGLLPKTNSEYSQMDFPLQSCVNERKQGSASQGLHCDTVTVPPSVAWSRETSRSLALILTWPSQSEMVIPAWDTWKTAVQHPPSASYMKGCLMLLDIHISQKPHCQT